MKIQNKHILFICSRLDVPGGIERAIINTANLLHSKGHKVSILILDDTEECFYPLNNEIVIEASPLHFGITPKGNPMTRKLSFLKHVRALRPLLKKADPDIIIGTDYVHTIAAGLAGIKKGVKIFSWEHHHFNHIYKSRFWQFLHSRIYSRIDGVICLNEEEESYFKKLGYKTRVIPNFIPHTKGEKAALNTKQLLTIGWLSKTKGMDLIPAIADIIFEKYPEWKWKIIGQGDLENKLKDHSANIELTGPRSPDINEVYLNSSVYVMTSRFECFPMVLLESMSAGVPAVSFDCPSGPRHIIRDGINGILVQKENIEAIADSIIELIADNEKRVRLGAQAYRDASEFSPENIYPLWKSLIDSPEGDRTR